MTLYEAGYGPGGVSFADILEGNVATAADTGLTVPRIAELITIGGWPGNLGSDVADGQRLVRAYVDQLANTDVPHLDESIRDPRGRRPDPRAISRLLRSLARNVATTASISTLVTDVNGRDGNLKRETVVGHLDALSRLFITEDLPAWRPSLRSRTRLREAEVRHLVDPSLAVAAMRASPETLLRDVKWLGFLFENLVVRDLRVYVQAAGAEVSSYRDATGLEVDIVVEHASIGWAAFEVKLGQGAVDGAAGSLLALRDRVDTRSIGEPAALVVVTATGLAYRRDDGVQVVPIGSLMP